MCVLNQHDHNVGYGKSIIYVRVPLSMCLNSFVIEPALYFQCMQGQQDDGRLQFEHHIHIRLLSYYYTAQIQ